MGRHVGYRDEDHFVWAWDQRAGGLVRLTYGAADHWRPRCHSGDLICPVGDCPSPAITTRRAHTRLGRWVHDSFVHRAAPTPGHGHESLAHIAGKLILAEWLRTVGCLEVHVERFDTQRRRRPDVTALTRTGQLVAFEVQFAPLAVHHWRRREQDLGSGGWTSVWLWGHRGDSHRASKSLEAVHREVIRDGGLLWWFDSTEASLGLGYERWKLPGSVRTIRTLPTGTESQVEVRWHALHDHDCRNCLTHRQVDVLRTGSNRLRQTQLDRLALLLTRVRDANERREQHGRRVEHQPTSAQVYRAVDYDSAWEAYRDQSEFGPFGYDNEIPPPDLVGKARSEWWNRWAARRR